MQIRRSAYGRQLCGGDARLIDSQVEESLAAFDVELDEPLRIWVYDEIDQPCSNETASGCYLPWSTEVHTRWSSVQHELVHAVVDTPPLSRSVDGPTRLRSARCIGRA